MSAPKQREGEPDGREQQHGQQPEREESGCVEPHRTAREVQLLLQRVGAALTRVAVQAIADLVEERAHHTIEERQRHLDFGEGRGRAPGLGELREPRLEQVALPWRDRHREAECDEQDAAAESGGETDGE